MNHRYFLRLSRIAIVMASCFSISHSAVAQDTQEFMKHGEQVRPVKLIQVGSTPSQLNKIFPAKVAANQQVDLAFRIHGQLNQLGLRAGQQVKKGDVLARLDDRDANNALLKVQADYQLAKADFTRKKELKARKLISNAEFDIAQAKLQATLAALNSSKDQLSYTQLAAPFSGVIAKVDLENHQMLQAGQVVLTLQGNSEFDLTFNVPESYLFNMDTKHAGYGVRFNGLTDVFSAKFKEMNTIANHGSQTYQITLTFTPPQALSILPGMSAEVVVNQQSNVTPMPVLPLTAIVHDQNKNQDFVWVYQGENKSLKKAQVELGKIRTEGTEIVSGLSQGDKVVAVGAHAITSDMKVKSLRWERGV